MEIFVNEQKTTVLIILIIIGFLCFFETANAQTFAGAENVLVVMNANVPESVEIGEYYQNQRKIPQENMFYLDIPWRIISRANIIPYSSSVDPSFENKIKIPLQNYLIENNLRDKILYIVMTYGMPYLVREEGERFKSLDSFLVDLFDEFGTRDNPYFKARHHFSRANADKGYLVTRLDGPLAWSGDSHYNKNTNHPNDSLQYIKNLVDYSIWAENNLNLNSGIGYFDSSKGYWGVKESYILTKTFGFEAILDENPELFGNSPAQLFCDNALWYAGEYSLFYKDAFNWKKGAVAYHTQSMSAGDIRERYTYEPWQKTDWLWVAGLIRDGITGTIGFVNEPGLGAVIPMDIFFGRFFHGFNFAESAYVAIGGVKFMQLVIGDPLYNPFKGNRLDEVSPVITITSPTEGELIWGQGVQIEGTASDNLESILFLDNLQPVENSNFSYFKQFAGVSGYNDGDEIILSVSATDSSNNTSKDTVAITWVYMPAGVVPPVFKELPEKITKEEGREIQFELGVWCLPDDILTFSAEQLPENARIIQSDSKYAVFLWIPDYYQAGIYDITLKVEDGKGGSDTVTVRFDIVDAGGPTNNPPVLKSIGNKTVTVDEKLQFTVFATDPDGDTLPFSAYSAINLPPGAFFYNRVFTWTPTSDQIASYDVIFTVDGKGGTTSETITITVIETDIISPTLFLVYAVYITDSQATIVWKTDEPATSQVEYGTSSAYGKTTQLDSTLVTFHSVSLSGLSANTVYHYRVRSKDASGNERKSTDNFFKTSTPEQKTLSVSFSANPSSGPVPLNKVDLTAKVLGTASGTINYTFYCDRSDDKTNITPDYEAKYTNVSQTSKTAFDICSYILPGIYTAKVIIEREELATEARLEIIVTDSFAPSTEITSPTKATTFTTNNSTISLAGTASDNVKVIEVSWLNDKGGSGIATGTTNWSVPLIGLQSGKNTIIITARDAANNKKTDILTVTYTPSPDLPKAPTNLTATSISQNQINLSWIDNLDNEHGFKIERKKGEAGIYKEIGTVMENITSYPDSNLLPETKYYYRICAYNTAGKSSYSNVVYATTKEKPEELPLEKAPAEEKPTEKTVEKEPVGMVGAKPISQMTPAERQAKIVEVKAKIAEVITTIARLKALLIEVIKQKIAEIIQKITELQLQL